MPTQNYDISFDANSGISEEEQREILEKINSIAEKNRLSLSAGSGTGAGNEKKHGFLQQEKTFKAQKSGRFFPLMINIIAILALAGGSITLYKLHAKTDARVREGAKIYNSAERALIDEIRKETFSLLNRKDNEITNVATKLSNIDTELKELYSGNQELTQEQKIEESRLKAMQEENLSVLLNLQDERSRILEEARVKETTLQANLEIRTREPAAAAEKGSDAAEIIERLSKDRTRSLAAEAQIGALFANLNEQINSGSLDDAASTVQSMRNFQKTQSIGSSQERKELYTQAIDSVEIMIEETRKNRSGSSRTPANTTQQPAAAEPAAPAVPAEPAAPSVVTTKDSANSEKLLAELRSRNARLEKDLADKEKTISALSSEGSSTAKVLADKDKQITDLRDNLTKQTQAAETSQQTLNTIRAENSSLSRTINNQRDSLRKIKDILETKELADMTFNELAGSVEKIRNALEQ